MCNLKIECYLIELKGNNLCWYYVIIIMLVRRVVARYDVAMVVLRKGVCALDLQSPAKFPILQAQSELVLFPNIKNRFSH